MKCLLRENRSNVETRTAQGEDLGLAASFVEASFKFVGLEELILVLVITWLNAEKVFESCSSAPALGLLNICVWSPCLAVWLV